MKKIVGVQSAADANPITEEDLQQMMKEAFANIEKITEKPTLDVFYKAIDEIWEKGLNKQLIFQNKDQHYAYITTYYNEQIAPLSLEQYKNLLRQQTVTQIQGLLYAIDREKQVQAYKLSEEHKKRVLSGMEEELDSLRERNKKVNKEIEEEIGHA